MAAKKPTKKLKSNKKPKGAGDLPNKDIKPPRYGSADTMARHATIRQQNMQSTPKSFPSFSKPTSKYDGVKSSFNAPRNTASALPARSGPSAGGGSSLYSRLTGGGGLRRHGR
jgi:hypothetical protein